MKIQRAITALMILTALSMACSDDTAPLPSDYADLGIDAGSIDNTLVGHWTRYVVTEKTYTNGQEYTRTLGNYTGDFRIESPDNGWNTLVVYNFPYAGMFEVRRYGERLNFYRRDTNQHSTYMIAGLSTTKVVFEQYQQHNDDYYVVTSYTLTK